MKIDSRSLLLPLLLLASARCFASWSIEADRSTAEIHGLFEIRQEARDFVARENAASRGGWWVALDPNLKILVAVQRSARDPMDTQEPRAHRTQRDGHL
ncbi:hypothetical protein J2W34_003276 [Variovorax boronicumulans]|uniref:hypothetical protein n=1 Tax=Variovorax boronicumulans TaxID=436515 RepID=UPI00278525F1|nr:hypothetical protein [Variovorax boronicumulans]MDQ0071482.1 hypothetical protein [Variovorax boronicumulans]